MQCIDFIPSILAFTFVLGVLYNTKLWFCLKLFMLMTVIVTVSFLQMVVKGFETSKFVVIKFQHINIFFKQQRNVIFVGITFLCYDL